MSGWTIVPDIRLKQVSYGFRTIEGGSESYIWGIDPDGKIYQFSDDKWNLINGNAPKFKWLSVGNDGTVWGVNSAQGIFKREGNTWTTISGGLSQISVGSSSEVWGVNNAQGIFKREGNTWTKISGGLSHISVGSDGTVWGINNTQQIFRRDGNTWTKIDGALTQISVGSASEVWGVNSAESIFRRDMELDKWTQIPGKLSQISVGSDGTVWGVKNNRVWKYSKECPLVMSNPYLKEERLEQGDTAKYGLSVTNISIGVIVYNLKLELIYNKDDFSSKGITILPSPPEKIEVSEELGPGDIVEVEFTISAAEGSEIGTYEFNGINAYYDVKSSVQPGSISMKNTEEKCLPFEVVKD